MTAFQIALSLAGGVLGAALLRWLDVRRAADETRRTTLAAVLTLTDEVRGNLGTLHALGTLQMSPSTVEPLTTTVYEAVRLPLARELPSALRVDLAAFYVTQVPQIAWMRGALAYEVGDTAPTRRPGSLMFETMHDRLNETYEALAAFASDLSDDAPPMVGPVSSGWQIPDPETGETAYQVMTKAGAVGREYVGAEGALARRYRRLALGLDRKPRAAWWRNVMRRKPKVAPPSAIDPSSKPLTGEQPHEESDTARRA